MHAVTSFYHPTLSDWEINTNPVPSVLSRAPEDETLRSALVEALDPTQGLCTNAGHERLLRLLLGGNGGTVEALNRALVGVIESNDRRVRPLCALAARTLTLKKNSPRPYLFFSGLYVSRVTKKSPRQEKKYYCQKSPRA